MQSHVYDGERCIYCNVNIYDEGIYGPTECVEREPIIHTTETESIMAENKNFKEGDLKVLYIPQVPMKAFEVNVERHTWEADSAYLQRAAEILSTIVNFSIFEFDNRIKPDYSDMAAIEKFEDGEWNDVDEEEYEKWLED